MVENIKGGKILYFPDLTLENSPFLGGHSELTFLQINAIQEYILQCFVRPTREFRVLMAYLALGESSCASIYDEIGALAMVTPTLACKIAQNEAQRLEAWIDRQEKWIGSRNSAKRIAMVPKDVLIWLAKHGKPIQSILVLILCTTGNRYNGYRAPLNQNRIANRLCISQSAINRAIRNLVASQLVVELPMKMRKQGKRYRFTCYRTKKPVAGKTLKTATGPSVITANH